MIVVRPTDELREVPGLKPHREVALRVAMRLYAYGTSRTPSPMPQLRMMQLEIYEGLKRSPTRTGPASAPRLLLGQPSQLACSGSASR